MKLDNYTSLFPVINTFLCILLLIKIGAINKASEKKSELLKVHKDGGQRLHILKNNEAVNDSARSDLSYTDIDAKILQLMRDKNIERKALLNGTYPEEYIKLTNNAFTHAILITVMAPEVICNDILKIGRVFDGGKWLCNPLKILHFDNCNIYSFGINNELSFEEQFQNVTRNNCKLYAFDQAEQKDETLKKIAEINGNFKQAKIGDVSNPKNSEYTFVDILKKHNANHIEILKIDIEGAENLVVGHLKQISVCQIIIEVHGKIEKEEDGKKTLVNYFSADQTLNILRTISRQGFYLFSYEVNIWANEIAEYGFIHESCLEKYGVSRIIGKFLI